ncbi:response regulator transcription factor [Clostridium uliginosum]|uniref:Stage 0 sporulation protein A homolog n=1 Tax=Clostridium uliginosum TaxID=119641 RepID=A0A1I1N8K4_9CLOT|nr:helix-turn-helix domain-containing protein [Clostridium uliginosum]SFC91093.1 two-component system, response regulator YesN [Clostridium uliginosum]
MIKVILADDENLELEALKIIINKKFKNASVVGIAHDGDEVIEMNEDLNPDVIFMNALMPGTNGFEVAKIIKKKDENKKIVLMSVYDDFEFVQRALKIKVDDYLLKPIRPEKIIKILDEFINSDKSHALEKNKSILLGNIKNHYYKESKDTLKQLIECLEKFSICESQKYSEELVRDMIDVFDIENNKLNNNVDYKKNFNSCLDIHDIENNLIDILDNLFDMLIYNRNLSDTDELKFLLNYIEKNFRNNIMLQDVADHMKFSSPYLSKSFKKHIGTNFNQYLTNRRIQEAKKILKNTSTSINVLAFDIGYNEPNYFCKVFKKLEGMTPVEYREKHRNQI